MNISYFKRIMESISREIPPVMIGVYISQKIVFKNMFQESSLLRVMLLTSLFYLIHILVREYKSFLKKNEK